MERVLEAAEHADLVGVLADALVTRGSALGYIGRVREGLGVIEIGERLARTHGLTSTLLRAINNRGASLYDFDPAAAVAITTEGLELARRVGDRGMLQSLRGLTGWGHMITGDLEGALASFEGGLADETEPADMLVLLDGMIIVRATRGEQVGELVAELERLAVGMSDSNVTWTTVDAPARTAVCEGRFAEAVRRWREGAARLPSQGPGWLAAAASTSLVAGDAAGAASALEALDATGLHSPAMDLRRRAARAGLAALDGRTAEAARGYRDALRGMLDLGFAWDHAVTSVEAATVLGPGQPEVQETIAIGRRALERMGAKPFLTRLDAALERPATGGDRVPRTRAADGLPATDASVPSP
jgi:hypothetical protein